LWQFDKLDGLPERPLEIIAPPKADLSASTNENLNTEMPTGSIRSGRRQR
jgi:hypothetical protein